MVQLHKKLGSLVALFFMLGSFPYAVANKVNVDVFPMFHFVDSKKDAVLDELVLKSQHEMMLYLEEHSNAYVFVESLYESRTKEEYFDSKSPQAELRGFYQKAIQVNFPNGVPFVYEQFTPNQKSIVEESGHAVEVMFQLGLVEAMLPTNSREEFESLVAKNVDHSNIDRLMAIMAGVLAPANAEEAAEFARFQVEVMEKREKLALENIQKFSERNPEVKNVVLVYGKNHDFMKYRDQDEFSNLNIRKVNTRRYDRNANNFLMGSYRNEPRYENYRFNPVTQTFEIIPGILSF